MQTTEVKPAVVEFYPEMPEAAQILSKARAYLSEPSHWIQGQLDDGNGGVCALGAFRKVASGPYADLTCLFRALPTHYQVQYGINAIPFYNDACTHADLLAWFDRAIALALEPSNAD